MEPVEPPVLLAVAPLAELPEVPLEVVAPLEAPVVAAVPLLEEVPELLVATVPLVLTPPVVPVVVALEGEVVEQAAARRRATAPSRAAPVVPACSRCACSFDSRTTATLLPRVAVS